MRGQKILRTLGLSIAILLTLYSVHNDLWAEPSQPDPPKITPIFMVEAYSSGDGVEGTVEVMELVEENSDMDELMLLACCVEAEAGNQSLLGKRLVVDVILNRVLNPDFPNSIPEVINQSNQFAVVQNGAIDTVIPSQETWLAVEREMRQRVDEEILFFQTDGFSPYGADAYRVDDHYFSGARQ